MKRRIHRGMWPRTRKFHRIPNHIPDGQVPHYVELKKKEETVLSRNTSKYLREMDKTWEQTNP